ncbi:MAG: hypothetical protein V4543_08930 [Bacteroidota bacterium]
MKALLGLILVIVSIGNTSAQDKYPKCQFTYFKQVYNKAKPHSNEKPKVSTSVCYDNDMRWGLCAAYNRAGQKIYEKQVRRIAGHASVSFDFYPDGAVKHAHYSSAPDAGIQWYKTDTWFAEDGIVTGETNNNYDDRVTLQVPDFKKQSSDTLTKEKPAPKAANCAIPYVTEIWFINWSGKPVKASGERIGNPAMNVSKTIEPNDSAKLAEVFYAEQFVKPEDYYRLSCVPLKGKRKLQTAKLVPETIPPRQRNYYLVK